MGLIDFSLGDIGSLLTSAREAITGKKILDPNEAAKIAADLEKAERALLQGQIEINKREAASDKLFVAGWRPFIGWVGGLALAWQFLAWPLLAWASRNLGWQSPPALDATILMQIVLAMLGLAGYRTLEKSKGVHDLH